MPEAFFICNECDTRIEDGWQYVCAQDEAHCDSCWSEYFCSDCEYSHDDCECDMNSDEGFGSSSGLVVQTMESAAPGFYISSLRAVGVEMEADGGIVRDVLAEMPSHILAGHHGEHCGHEFVTQPFRGVDLENNVTKAVDILRGNGWTEYEDCGLHFHVDCTQESAETRSRAVALLRVAEGMLFSLSDGRENSSWCRPSSAQYSVDIPAMLRNGAVIHRGYNVQRDRYCLVNAHALDEHGTVEIRVMDGAAQADLPRLFRAISLATAIVDFAASISHDDARFYIGQPENLVRSLVEFDYMPANVGADILAGFTAWNLAAGIRMARRAERDQALLELSEANARIMDDIATAQRIAQEFAESRAIAEMTAYRNAQERYESATARVEEMRNALRIAERAMYDLSDRVLSTRRAFQSATRNTFMPDVSNAQDAAWQAHHDAEMAVRRAFPDVR